MASVYHGWPQVAGAETVGTAIVTYLVFELLEGRYDCGFIQNVPINLNGADVSGGSNSPGRNAL